MTITRQPEWNAEEAAALIAPIVAAESGPVLLCLQAVQAHYGHVYSDAIALIADACNVSRADVHGVFTFMRIYVRPHPLQCRCDCARLKPAKRWVHAR